MRFDAGPLLLLLLAAAAAAPMVESFAAPPSLSSQHRVGNNAAARSFPRPMSPTVRSDRLAPSAVAPAAAAAAVNGVPPAAAAAASREKKGDAAPPPDLNIRLNVNEKARTVTSICTSGTLCTTSRSEGIAGAPFGSFVDYVLDDDGNPVLLMNEMSMHTVNILNDPDGMVTLFAQLGATGGLEAQGQDVSRCSLTGTIERVDDRAPDADAIRMRYSIAHAYADQVMDSPKFAFYRIRPVGVYFVGGFGVLAKWVPVDEYRAATPDVLARDAPDIVSRLNRDHADDLFLTAEHLLDCREVEKVRVTAVDRLGMDMRVTKRGPRRNRLITDEFRVGFRIPVISVEDAKSEILKIFQEAWEKGNGYVWGDDDEPGSSVPIVKIAEDSL